MALVALATLVQVGQLMQGLADQPIPVLEALVTLGLEALKTQGLAVTLIVARVARATTVPEVLRMLVQVERLTTVLEVHAMKVREEHVTQAPVERVRTVQVCVADPSQM